MLAQSSNPDPALQLIQSIGPEPLAAIMIIATVGTIVFLIITVSGIISTINNVTTMKMSQSMTKNLLEKGYSVEDVERLVFGHGQPWGKRVKKMFRTARNRWQQQAPPVYQPMPPVKSAANNAQPVA